MYFQIVASSQRVTISRLHLRLVVLLGVEASSRSQKAVLNAQTQTQRRVVVVVFRSTTRLVYSSRCDFDADEQSICLRDLSKKCVGAASTSSRRRRRRRRRERTKRCDRRNVSLFSLVLVRVVRWEKKPNHFLRLHSPLFDGNFQPLTCKQHRQILMEVCEIVRRKISANLVAMRRLEVFLDAYKLDGWRSSNKEKLKPKVEILRVREDVFSRKLKVRKLFESGLNYDEKKRRTFKLEEDSEGEIDGEDIRCCECGSGECDGEEGDILLCDGWCDLAYHQKCVKPPVSEKDVPEGDKGWLCPMCDCRCDVLYYLNHDHGQKLDIETCTHRDIFKRESKMADKGIVPGTARFHLHDDKENEEWPSDESCDEDFVAKNEDADGEDDSDEALSGSGGGSSSSSSSSEDSAVIINGPRKRKKVDYVKLNGEMFGDAILDGDEEEKEEEEEEEEIEQKTKRKNTHH